MLLNNDSPAKKSVIVRDGVVRGCETALTQHRLKQVLEYDPETGLFKRLGKNMSKTGTLDKSNGYVKIMVDGIVYRAHRLAFLYMEGAFPPNDVDHKNTDKADNRWRNLRHATPSQNGGNKRVSAKNPLRLKSVRFAKGKYYSSIKIMGVVIRLGTFKTPEEAHAAYLGAAKVLYGDFARAS